MSLSMELIVCTADAERGVQAANAMMVKATNLVFASAVVDGGPRERQYYANARRDGDEFSVRSIGTGEKRGPVGCLQFAYKDVTGSGDILALIHDDVVIHEQGWDARVLREFADPTVGVVGFGGATGLADDDIYLTPYRLQQLARHNYASNVDDAEVHGERFTGERDVAVLDGFCLIVRRELLDKCGGWKPDVWPPHHCYDMRVCAEAKRHGYRVRLVGIRCHHYGGRTAVGKAYQDWCATTKYGSDSEMHRQGHELFYQEYRDVLPIRV